MNAWMFRLTVGFEKVAAPGSSRFEEWRNRRLMRQSYGRLSDEELQDIALTRYDVQAALALPLNQSAQSALERAAAERAANW